MKKQLIGAMITIKDTLENDYNRIFKAYVSFGEYKDKKNKDSYGVDDYFIFYYFDSLKHLKNSIKREFDEGYKLLKINRLEYK